MRIPADMIREDLATSQGAGTIVSIRDLLVLLGASDQILRDCDERDEILSREPWRREGIKFVPCLDKDGNEIRWGEGRVGTTQGKIDWSGTRFENT